MGEMSRIQGFVAKRKGKRPLGIPRHRWEDIIKTDVQEEGCGSRDWIELAQDRDSLEPVSFSRKTLLHAAGQSVRAARH